ncbi:MAG: aquaporin family protein [Candidatus Limnocylindrales bacterium]|jgi:glycerol uptake facilitator protein|nr:aquaporin family protein [Candidatus Limnocylindrales bacterium]
MSAEKFIGEVLGTMILILLGDGVVAGVLLNKSKAQAGGWIVITVAWGMAVFAGIAVAGTFTGAHMNPAVTLAVFIQSSINNGTFGADQLVGYWAGEFVGAMIGATLVFLHYYPHWAETEDPGLKLAVFSTGPAIRNPMWNLVSEIIGTFVLIFVGFSLGNATGVSSSIGGALGWGLLVLVIGLGLGGTTGYAINPARDLGPRIMHAVLPIPGKGSSDWEYAWIPVVGPLIGGAIGVLVYNYGITEFVAKALGPK